MTTATAVVHLSVVISSISMLLIFFQLYITSKLRPTGFLVIISSLAICNIIYNVGFYFRLNTEWGDGIFFYFLVFSDTAMGVWTNIMSLVLLRIVRSLQPVDILKEYPYYLALSIGLPMPIIIVSAAVDGLGFTIMDIGFRCYYWMRIGIIVLNIVLYAKTKYLVSHLGSRVAKGDLTNDQAHSIKLLVSRMRYYGVAQAVTRIGPTWHDYDNTTHESLASGVIGATCGTSIGVAYFILFVYMQPQAWEIIREKYLVKYLPCCLPSTWLGNANKEHASARLTNWNLGEVDDEEIMSRISSISVKNTPKNSSTLSTIRETETTEESGMELH